jgi:pimeloyl-ACP methyl ester carboxylesterase
MTPAESGLQFTSRGITGVPPDALSTVRTNAVSDARPPGHAGLIDPSRMVMAGHSVGGAAAIAAMLADSRIRAAIDMDGATVAPIPDHGLSRPFLFLGTSPAEPAVSTLPRGHVLFAGRLKPAMAS